MPTKGMGAWVAGPWLQRAANAAWRGVHVCTQPCKTQTLGARRECRQAQVAVEPDECGGLQRQADAVRERVPVPAPAPRAHSIPPSLVPQHAAAGAVYQRISKENHRVFLTVHGASACSEQPRIRTWTTSQPHWAWLRYAALRQSTLLYEDSAYSSAQSASQQPTIFFRTWARANHAGALWRYSWKCFYAHHNLNSVWHITERTGADSPRGCRYKEPQ